MTDAFGRLLLDVWREACRHIEITVSTATIAPMLANHMPLAQVFVRRLDQDRGCLETVALGLPQGARALPDARSECRGGRLEAILDWAARRRVCRRLADDAPRELLDTLIPAGVEGDALVGPLGSATQVFGVLVAIAPVGCPYDARHATLVEMLLEPFSAAMENDQRLREVAALREAAEADKRSLLTRLGRKALADAVVGADSGMRAVMERVELVAPSDVPVLIVGETGTGKELVSRLIHNRSRRAHGPFIRVNCGAIPPELIDSQLFGHERGAFTGAVETRQGWFERADGGTLLLDELGELPPAAQVRLLRILQDGWLERVGGSRPIHVDVRIVAATHRDLAAMAAEGRFREDLWYRIAVFPILLPPLRERREDIAALAAHFAERAATRFGLPLVLPTAEDIRLLQAYDWPWSIRELAAVIDRAAILGNGARLDVATALGAAGPWSGAAPAQADRQAAPTPQPHGARAIVPLDVAMRRHIEAALAATGGRIEGPRGAAALLEINPHTLRAPMRKLGIDWTRFRLGGRGP
jgi:transcriptional regulator with GAF, ATPase, and Fis domain